MKIYLKITVPINRLQIQGRDFDLMTFITNFDLTVSLHSDYCRNSNTYAIFVYDRHALFERDGDVEMHETQV